MMRFLPVPLTCPGSLRRTGREGRNPRLGFLSCVGQAHTTEAIAECIGSGGVGEAESDVGLLGLVSAATAANRDAPLTVERVKVKEHATKASGWTCEFD
jgi:hypothetical protein